MKAKAIFLNCLIWAEFSRQQQHARGSGLLAPTPTPQAGGNTKGSLPPTGSLEMAGGGRASEACEWLKWWRAAAETPDASGLHALPSASVFELRVGGWWLMVDG